MKAPVKRTELFSPLKLPAFRRVWAGQALSAVGDGLFPVVLAGAILEHHRATDLGLVLGAESLLLVLVALAGGVLADRVRRTKAMIGSDVLRTVAVAGFALGAAQGPLPVAIVLAMAMGLGTGLFRPAGQALLPTLAPDLLTQANALQSVTTRAALIAGPALGGLFLVLSSANAAFWFDAATYVVGIITLLGVRDGKPVRAQEAGVFAEAKEGIKAVLDRPWVAIIIGQGTVQLLLVMAPALILLPIYLHHHAQLPSYGLMLSLQAAGSGCGGLLVGIRPPRKPGVVGVLGLGLLSFQLLCMIFAAPLPVLGASVFLTGLGYALFGVLWASGLQTAIPDGLLGRVFAVEMLGTYALEPVGLSLAPSAAGLLGLRTVLAVALVVLVITTVVPLFVPGVKEFADPPGKETEPEEEASAQAR